MLMPETPRPSSIYERNRGQCKRYQSPSNTQSEIVLDGCQTAGEVLSRLTRYPLSAHLSEEDAYAKSCISRAARRDDHRVSFNRRCGRQPRQWTVGLDLAGHAHERGRDARAYGGGH